MGHCVAQGQQAEAACRTMGTWWGGDKGLWGQRLEEGSKFLAQSPGSSPPGYEATRSLSSL